MNIKPYPHNPRRITEQRAAKLAADLATFGDLGGIVHDVNTGQLVGGHQRLRVLFGEEAGAFKVTEADIEIVKAFDAPDMQGTLAHGFIVWRGFRYAYRQVAWDEPTFREANVKANLDGGAWDFDELSGWDAAELTAWGFDDAQLNDWNDAAANLRTMIEAEQAANEAADVAPQVDRADELQAKWQVQTGDVWQCGEHFVLRGDCREDESWRRLLAAAGVEKSALLLTDPPYGIERDEGFEGFGGFGSPIARRKYSDDWDSERPEKDIFDKALQMSDKCIIFGGNFFADFLPRSTHWIVWDKMQTMPTFGDCELAWTNIGRKSVKKFTVQYNGLLGKEKERFHPTQKPITLFAEIIKEYSDDGDVIFDPFCGSGTTIVAAHNEGRRGLGIERLEKYVAVILERLTDVTGAIPVKVS